MIENRDLAYYVKQIYDGNISELYLDKNLDVTTSNSVDKRIYITKAFIDEFFSDIIFEIETSTDYAVSDEFDQEHIFVDKLEEFLDSEQNFWEVL